MLAVLSLSLLLNWTYIHECAYTLNNVLVYELYINGMGYIKGDLIWEKEEVGLGLYIYWREEGCKVLGSFRKWDCRMGGWMAKKEEEQKKD